jgi:hypothetical protein
MAIQTLLTERNQRMEAKGLPIEERTLFKMLEYRGDEAPIVWITLVANSSAEYYSLRKKLELFASILQERDMKCPLCNEVMR